jgi:SpoVK/Ycf46/Vps4 family AAA+-type ATPase
MLSISRNTRDDDIIELFRTAETMAPAMIMLEDLDSLTRESQVSRATLLAQLDGLDSKRGILMIGTTNHPEKIDPALTHRPSRFDRVWHFPLPDQAMRREYLQWAFAGLDGEIIVRLARQTTDYSFAYLKELHTTAAILAMEQLPATITPDHVERAHQLLAAQFQAGKKNRICSESETGLGFRAA